MGQRVRVTVKTRTVKKMTHRNGKKKGTLVRKKKKK